jgi:hypothetical protein
MVLEVTLKYGGGDNFISYKILKKPLQVQKQTVPFMKAQILIFLKLEERGCGIIMGAPRPLSVKRFIKVKEIK